MEQLCNRYMIIVYFSLAHYFVSVFLVLFSIVSTLLSFPLVFMFVGVVVVEMEPETW